MDYTSLPVFVPTMDVAEIGVITASHFVRQNPWKSKMNSTATVIRAKTIHAPHGHAYDDYAAFQNDPVGYRSTCGSDPRHFIDIPTGSCVFVPSADRHRWPGLLVRITGEPYTDVCAHMFAVHGRRACEHQVHVRNCVACHATGIVAMDESRMEEAVRMVLSGTYFIEPFWAIQRSVEVLGVVDTEGHDMRTLATPASIAALSSSWVLKT